MHNRPLRVAWDNSLLRRNPTGTGVYATQLIRELSALPDLDLRVLEGWDPAQRQPGDFGSQGVLARGVRALSAVAWNYGYFPLLLRRGSFDLLHAPAFVVPAFCPCPAVVTVHDLSFKFYPAHFERRWQLYMNHVFPSVLRSVAAIICVSQQTKHDLLKTYNVDPGKVHVVYNGIDHAAFHPAATLDPDWARGIGLRQDKDYVLHVGLLSERKNLPTLLRAIAALRSRGRFAGLQLVLAGPQLSVLTGAPEIHAAIRDLGLAEVVVLTGQVPAEHLPGLYARARLLVMPSLYEGFGLPVLEAMASGVPVVGSDSSSLPEVAGGAATLVPPLDEPAWAAAIQAVLEDPALAAELRRRGLARAAEFSWQRAAAETLAVYRSVAGA